MFIWSYMSKSVALRLFYVSESVIFYYYHVSKSVNI